MLTWTSHKVCGTSVKSLSKGAMQTEQIRLSAALCSTPEIPRLHISLVTISLDPPLITVSHTEFFFEWKPLNVTDVFPPPKRSVFVITEQSISEDSSIFFINRVWTVHKCNHLLKQPLPRQTDAAHLSKAARCMNQTSSIPASILLLHLQ